MASRFDTIPQFNPFIQPAPLDLVAQVGLKKEGDYQQGVQKIQSYIDKVSGIDLAKDVDKQYLQDQLGKLGDNIKKVASQDFSNPNLQGAIGGLAMGIFNDKNIQNGYVGTQKIRQKQALIGDIRKSKPELYNPSNEAYAMLDITHWLNDGTAGSPLVDNHDYYNYHDTGKEIREAMASFKPSKIKRKLPQGEWMVTDTDQSWTDPEVREYLNGVLSPEAKQQFKIDGVVAFMGKDDALLSSYYDGLKTNVSSNTDLINRYNAQVAVVPKEQQDALRQRISTLKEQNLDLSSYIDKIDSKDLDFFNANKEGIAGKLYTDESLKAATRAYSHPDIEQEYDANEIWRTKFTQSMENARSNARMAFDAQQNALNRDQQKDLKLLELGYRYYDSNGNLKKVGPDMGLEKSPTNITEANKSVSGKDIYEQELASVHSSITDAYNNVRKELIENDPNIRDQYQKFLREGGREYTSNDPSAVATEAYIKDQARRPIQNRDKWGQEYLEIINSMNTRQSVLAQKKAQIDDEVTRNYGKEMTNALNAVNTFSPISVPTYKIMTNDNVGSPTYGSVTSVTKTGSATITGKDILDYAVGASSPSKSRAIFDAINTSPQYSGDAKANQQIKDYYDNVIAKVGGRAKVNTLIDALKFENGLYNQSTLNLGDWWTPVGDKNPDVKRAITYISNQVGGQSSEFTVARVNRSTGEIQFRIDPKKTADGKSTSEIDVNFVKSLGYKYDDANQTFSTDKLDYFKRDYTGFTPTEQELVRALDINTNLDRRSYSTPAHMWDPNGNGHFIRIVKSVGKDGSDRYWFKDENNNVLIDQVDFQDPISAINAAKAYTGNPDRATIIANSKK